MAALLDEIAPHVPADRLVIIAAAGITTSFFERAARRGHPGGPRHAQHARPGRRGDERHLGGQPRHRGQHLSAPRTCFSRVGKTLRIPETQQDAATALSGSGPAYFYYLVEAMADAGILLGLPRAARPTT